MNKNLSFLTFKALYTKQKPLEFLIFQALDPIIHYLFFALIAITVLGKEYIEFIIIGNIVFYIGTTNIINFMMIFRMERNFGTLEYNVSSPTSVLQLIIKRSIIPIFNSLFIMLISCIFAYYVFEITIDTKNILYVVACIFGIYFSVISFSLIVSSFGLVLRNVNLYINSILGLIQIFCGINFPVDLLPNFLQKLAHILPITNGLLVLRQVIDGKDFSDVSNYLLYEYLIGAVLLFIGIVLIKVMEKLALKNGSLLKFN